MRREWAGFVVAMVIGASCAAESNDAPTAAEATTVAATAAGVAPVTEPTSPPVPLVSTTVPAAPTAAPTTAPPVATPTGFAGSVKPVLEAHCASCHTGGGPGSPHFPMDTAEMVVAGAQFIANSVGGGYMPPWPAADGDLPFHRDRRLSEDQIQAVVDWVKAGSPLDVEPTSSLTATAQTIIPIERDVVMVGAPYKGSAALPDDYRCQIYDPQLTERSYLQGMDIEADQKAVVHHGLIFVVPASARANVDQQDAADDKAGFACDGLPRLSDGNLVNSWAPGQAPVRLPADTGIVMEAGDFFITQIHYHYSDETAEVPPDASTVVADFASDEVIEAAGGSLDPVTLSLYLGPAEIPCTTEQSGPLCDRQAALDEMSERGIPFSQFIGNGLLRQCGKSVEDFAGMTSGIATASCDLPALPGRIVSIWGHEHEIGKSFRMVLNPETPEEKVLLDIPRWDFDWQLTYEPVDDVVLKAGDVIRVECTWDRSVHPYGAEDRYITWAEGTADEMCYSQVVTRPA